MAGSRASQKPKHDYGGAKKKALAARQRKLDEAAQERKLEKTRAREAEKEKKKSSRYDTPSTPSRFDDPYSRGSVLTSRFSGLGYGRSWLSTGAGVGSSRFESAFPRTSGLESRVPARDDIQEADGWYTLDGIKYDSHNFTQRAVREIHPQVNGILPTYQREEPFGDPRALLVTDSSNGSYFVRMERERFSSTTISLPWINNDGIGGYGRTSDPTKLLDRERVLTKE